MVGLFPPKALVAAVDNNVVHARSCALVVLPVLELLNLISPPLLKKCLALAAEVNCTRIVLLIVEFHEAPYMPGHVSDTVPLVVVND